MIKTINGKIIGVTPGKSGTANKDGRSFTWQMYDVAINEDKTGQDFMLTAFDEQYLNLIGKEGSWTYKEEVIEKNGKQYTRRTLEKLPKQGQDQRVMEELAKLSRKMDEILELVSIRTTIKHPAIGEKGEGSDFDSNSIPF